MLKTTLTLPRRALHRLALIGDFKARALRARAMPQHVPRTIATWPEKPYPRAVLYKICHVRGWRMARDPHASADLAIHWEDATHRLREWPDCAEHAGTRVLNRACRDISKRYVGELHRRVLGYGLEVDPHQWVGDCVEKSDLNAAHDGRIVRAPLAVLRSGVVHQRIVDNRIDAQTVEDIRIPVIGTQLPFCYLKRRPVATRFSNRNSMVVPCEVDAVLTGEECRALQRFARAIGLDYGELDALRDAGDGRLYVVDVNTTPDGPPNGLSVSESDRALARLADAFEREFMPIASGVRSSV